ncbi:MAG TPA: amidohydrolase [Spirochaetales bacterium]|nr:amidohydrolase [Spirochaetales bacterium]
MTDIIVKNATVVTVNNKREILKDHSIAIENDRITEIGPANEMAQKFKGVKKEIEAVGKIVFPGFVNTHNHLFQTLLKGLGDDKVLSEWFTTMTAPSAKLLTEEAVYNAAMLGCLEGINSGTTTVLDYMYPHPVPNLSDSVIRAFKELQIRGIFGRGSVDTGIGIPQEIMQDPGTVEKDFIRLFETYHGSENGRIRIWLAPAAVWLATEEMLLTTWRLAQKYNTGFTIHISETPFDRQASAELHGQPDMEVLQKLRITGPNVLLVHCVYLTERDMRMARFYDMKVSHNPVSNMYLASGVAPIPRMIESGITVGIATDGAASNNTNDMLEVVRMTPLLHKVHTMDPTILTAAKVLEMATIDGARAIGLEAEIGSLETGKKADLFIYNPVLSARSIPMNNPVSTIVYSGSEKCVETVIIDGNILKEDSRLLVADEEKILQNAQKSADKLSVMAGTAKIKERPWQVLAF